MSTSAQRFEWIDRVRGIAMVLIVAGHVWNRLWKTGQLDSLPLYENMRDFLYSFHVPVFFFVSAILFTRALVSKPVPGLLRQRAMQLLYPYFIWSLLQTSIEVLSGSVSENPLGEFLRILYWPRAHFWFLPTLLLLMLMAAGVYKLPRIGGRWSLVLGLLSLGLYLLSRWVDLTPFQDFAKNSLYFAGGVACARLPEVLQARPPRRLGLFACILIFAILSWFWIPRGGYADIFGQPILAVTGILATIALALLWLDSRYLDPSFLGRKSLVIYVAHILAAYAVMDLLGRFGLGWASLLVIGVLSGIVIPLILDVVCIRLGFPWLFTPPQRRNE